MQISNLPIRSGPRPITTSGAPHIQLDQNAPPELLEALAKRVFTLPGIEERPTHLSAQGARAIWLQDGVPASSADAFLGRREIGHFHPWDGSLHIALPPGLAREAVENGWAEVHPAAAAGGAPKNVVMLYGPRDQGEADVILELVLAACRRAIGIVL
jgi:hypothetical protein